MSYNDTQQGTLQTKDKVRTLNLGAYLIVIAVSGLAFGAAAPLGFLSAVLVSSFALALFYSIDNQLLNDALMLKVEHYTQAAKSVVVCDINEKRLSQLASEDALKPLVKREAAEPLENVA